MPGTNESFVGLDIWTMIFAWGNIIILYLFLKKILFVPIKNAIDARQKQIGDMYTEAQKDREAADAMRAEYEQKLEKASHEGEEIVRNAVQRAHEQEERIVSEAKENAQRTLKRAEEQIDLEKKKAMNDIKDEVSGMAVDIASAVIGKNLTEEDNSEMIDDFIASLGETK